eukprot:5815713-Pleurochrysis_carterae.AAC.2
MALMRVPVRASDTRSLARHSRAPVQSGSKGRRVCTGCLGRCTRGKEGVVYVSTLHYAMKCKQQTPNGARAEWFSKQALYKTFAQ